MLVRPECLHADRGQTDGQDDVVGTALCDDQWFRDGHWRPVRSLHVIRYPGESPGRRVRHVGPSGHLGVKTSLSGNEAFCAAQPEHEDVSTCVCSTNAMDANNNNNNNNNNNKTKII